MATDILAALRRSAEADVNGGGNYIRGGTYLLEVTEILFEQKRNGLCFIPSLIVREAQATARNPDHAAYGDKAGQDAVPNKIGETVSTVINFDGKGKDMAPVNTKAFVCGLFGLDPTSVPEQDFIDTVYGTGEGDDRMPGLRDPEQPAKGMLIRCVAVPLVTKNTKQAFTKLNWSHVEQTAEEVAERRAAQEGRKAA